MRAASRASMGGPAAADVVSGTDISGGSEFAASMGVVTFDESAGDVARLPDPSAAHPINATAVIPIQHDATLLVRTIRRPVRAHSATWECAGPALPITGRTRSH